MKVEIIKTSSRTKARVLKIHTAHGTFLTPRFMPVGTHAGVNNLTPDELKQCDTQIILGGNTYHMLNKPGMKVIQEAGGMHRFMGWHRSLLTDSGGFQIFSLNKKQPQCRVDNGGVYFSTPAQRETIYMTPTLSMQIQKIIGADLIMAFDQCTPLTAGYNEAVDMMERTHRWLLNCIDYHHRDPCSIYGFSQALFGIVQGGLYDDLRQKSATWMATLPLDGIALGGEVIGYDMAKTRTLIAAVYDLLPITKPRYTMGVGLSPQNLLDVMIEGIDLFDCVAPTRNARHGALYSGYFVDQGDWIAFESDFENGRLSIKKACFEKDDRSIMMDCRCWTCLHHSRAYLHYLFKTKATAFVALATLHNVQVMHETCRLVRNKILNGVTDIP